MRKILFISSLIFSMIFLIGNSFAQETKEELYSFGGHVFADGLPLTYCTAQLLIIEDGFPIVVDEVEFDTLGYYYFYRKPAGEYLILAGPVLGHPEFNKYFYTFYPTGTNWANVDAIEIKEDHWEYDINLVVNDETGEGFGKISGLVINDENNINAENIDVLLLDSEMNPITHLLTDENGNFSFNDLEIGDYIVFPRIIGYYTEPISISINNNNLEHQDIQITIKDGVIASYINEDIVVENSFLFFPNPSSNYINIQFETKGNQEIQSRVLDISGRIIFETSSEKTSFYTNRIETADWQNGYYFIEVLVNGQKAITQKMAVLH